MQWNRRGQLLGGLVIGAVLWSGALSGCSSAGTEAAPTTTASSESAEPAATEADETYRTDLVDEWVVEWERYEIIDENSIRFFFTTGPENCFGARAEVEETADAVQIAVIEGRPAGGPEMCTLIARQASIVVETAEPIADREIIPLADPKLNSEDTSEDDA